MRKFEYSYVGGGGGGLPVFSQLYSVKLSDCLRASNRYCSHSRWVCLLALRQVTLGPKDALTMVIILSVSQTESECFGLPHAYSPLVLFCTTRFNSWILCVLRTHLICVFCMDLRTFSYYFPVQHQVIDWSSALSHTLWKASVSLCVRASVCVYNVGSQWTDFREIWQTC